MTGTTDTALIRPRTLIRTARIGARLYRRERDLDAALPNGARGAVREAAAAIVAQLAQAERRCETLRRDRSPAYTPARHVQVLAALLAETGALA